MDSAWRLAFAQLCWGCLLGPEKLEADWRTGAGLLCPARKLGPVGSAWPSPWPCGRPAATPACAWRSWRMGPRSRMVPAIASGLVAVPWVPLAIWPVALGCKCSLLGGDWPRWLVSPLLLWAAVVVSLALSSPCHLLVGAVVASWDQGLRLRDFLCRTWGPRCLGGRLWSVRGSGWDGGWLHRGGPTGWVLELGRC